MMYYRESSLDFYTIYLQQIIVNYSNKNYTYIFFYISTPHTDGYNRKFDHKEFDRKIQ